MKKGGGTSRDREHDRTYKSESENRKLKWVEEAVKIAFLKANAREVDKEQEPMEEIIEEEVCASVKK